LEDEARRLSHSEELAASATALYEAISGGDRALLGGLGSLRGALLGGLAVGLVQSVAVWAWGATLQDVAPLTLLVVVLALRPQGLRA
jgi:ABC-type branched-subunit amino acid transport system permease subunit